MSDVDWNNVVSAVATEEGLLVTERGADGTVGASPRLLPARVTARRATSLDFLQLPKTRQEFLVLELKKGLEQFAPTVMMIPGLLCYTNPYKNLGWEDIDEARAILFTQWWNANKAGKPKSGFVEPAVYGGLLTCGCPGTCSVLNWAETLYAFLQVWLKGQAMSSTGPAPQFKPPTRAF